jgi:hypothetical protein
MEKFDEERLRGVVGHVHSFRYGKERKSDTRERTGVAICNKGVLDVQVRINSYGVEY